MDDSTFALHTAVDIHPDLPAEPYHDNARVPGTSLWAKIENVIRMSDRLELRVRRVHQRFLLRRLHHGNAVGHEQILGHCDHRGSDGGLYGLWWIGIGCMDRPVPVPAAA